MTANRTPINLRGILERIPALVFSFSLLLTSGCSPPAVTVKGIELQPVAAALVSGLKGPEGSSSVAVEDPATRFLVVQFQTSRTSLEEIEPIVFSNPDEMELHPEFRCTVQDTKGNSYEQFHFGQTLDQKRKRVLFEYGFQVPKSSRNLVLKFSGGQLVPLKSLLKIVEDGSGTWRSGEGLVR